MSEKIIDYSEQQLKSLIHNIIRQMNVWRPDYVVGISRGGLIPAVMISHYLGVPMNTLKVSFRDDDEIESNLWMARDSFGYYEKSSNGPGCSDPAHRKNILLVDDINDSGATLEWIKQDWQNGCLPHDPAWETVWNNNVRFAVLVDNETSKFTNIDYSGTSVNKFNDPCWFSFPWEEWWKR